jgi:hypothetical protein
MAVRPEPLPMPWPAKSAHDGTGDGTLGVGGRITGLGANIGDDAAHGADRRELHAANLARLRVGGLVRRMCPGCGDEHAAAVSAAAMASRRRVAWAMEMEAFRMKAGCAMADSSCARWIGMTRAPTPPHCVVVPRSKRVRLCTMCRFPA